MANFEESQKKSQEKILHRPDLEWVKKTNFKDKDFFRNLERRLQNASRFITPDKLDKLTTEQAKTRIGRALHVYSMWIGRLSLYEGVSPLLPEEFQNDSYFGFLGRARFVIREINDLGRAIHTALHQKDLKPDDFPESLYGFGAVQLRLMELKNRETYKVDKADDYPDTPDIEGSYELKATVDRELSPEEIEEMYQTAKDSFQRESPLASFPAEDYINQMDHITKTYMGASFEEALYGKIGLPQRQTREVLRHLDNLHTKFSQLHQEQYQRVLNLTKNSPDFDWENVLLHQRSLPIDSTETALKPENQSGNISNQVFELLSENLSQLSPDLIEFILGDDFLYYSRNAGGGQAAVVSGLPYPETKPFIRATVNSDQNWDNLFFQAHELGHVFQMMFKLAELDELSKHPFAKNYNEKKLDQSTTAEIFSHLAVNIFFDKILAKIEKLDLSEKEKLVLEIQVRMAFEYGVANQIFSLNEHDVDPQYVGYAFAIEVAETRDTQAALDRMEEGTLPNLFSNMREYGYIYELRHFEGEMYNTYLPLPGQDLPEELVPYNREAEENNAIGNGDLYKREVEYVSKTSTLAHHISTDHYFTNLPYQVASPTALGLWNISKRVVEMGKMSEQDIQNLWQDLAINNEASFQEIVEIALKRINEAVGMTPALDFTNLYGIGMREIATNKQKIVDCIKKLEEVGLPNQPVNFSETIKKINQTSPKPGE